MSVAEPIATDEIREGEAVAPVSGSGEGYVVLALVCAIALAVGLLMWRSSATLLAEWSDTENLTYTHGYLIVAVCLWSLLRSCKFATAAISPHLGVAAVVALTSLVWLIAYRAGLLVVHQSLLPATMWLAVCAICGWTIASRCWFGFAYLYFAVPVWSLLNSTLQHATTAAMKAMLPIVGVPTYFDGNIVHIPAGVFEIAGGCSGLHFFIVGVAIAALYGEIHRDSLRTRVKLLAMAAGLSIVANWIRVFTIIVAGHMSDMQHFLVQVDHYYFGWFVFAAAMLLFFYVASRMPQSAASPALRVGAKKGGWARVGVVATLTFLAVAIGPIRAAQAVSRIATNVEASLPQGTGQWQGPSTGGQDWQPKFAKADAAAQGVFSQGDVQVEAFVALYRDQYQGKEFGGGGNSMPGDSLQVQSPRRALNNGFGERIVSDLAGTRWVMWDTYQVGERRFYSSTLGQLWYGFNSIWRAPVSSVLGLRARCAADCDSARRHLDEYVKTFANNDSKGN